MKNDMPQILERYGDPSIFDTAPYLSVCINTSDNTVWVQMAKDEDAVQWMAFDSIEEALLFAENQKKI